MPVDKVRAATVRKSMSLVFSFFQVFLPGCFPAAQVSLGFVFLQYLLYGIIERAIDGVQIFGDVFMYGAFADPETARRVSYGLAGGGDVFPDLLTARFSA